MSVVDLPRMRAANPADADRLADLIRIAFATQPVPLDPPPSALQETSRNVADILAKGGGAMVEVSEKPVAGILWHPTERGTYVSRLSVYPDWRRHGLATTLLREAIDQGRRHGMWLSVRLALVGNRRLFAAHGFIETIRHAHPGHSLPTYVDMERPPDA